MANPFADQHFWWPTQIPQDPFSLSVCIPWHCGSFNRGWPLGYWSPLCPHSYKHGSSWEIILLLWESLADAY